eukprot:647845-Alexandrium_andersonii.AAC.1
MGRETPRRRSPRRRQSRPRPTEPPEGPGRRRCTTGDVIVLRAREGAGPLAVAAGAGRPEGGVEAGVVLVKARALGGGEHFSLGEVHP